jgi:hypothetical protein
MRRTLHGPPHPAFSAPYAFAVFMTLAALALGAALPAGAAASAHEEPFIQGRCVSFDPVSRTVQIAKDLKSDPADPDYGQFPPASFVLASSDGPEPRAGRRMKLDAAAGRIVLYDPATKGARTVPIHILVKRPRVDKDDPLVFDHAAGTPRKLPKVDRAAGTVTMYSKRLELLVVFSPPHDLLDLPEEAWDSGDEVRITYGPNGVVRTYENLSRSAK